MPNDLINSTNMGLTHYDNLSAPSAGKYHISERRYLESGKGRREEGREEGGREEGEREGGRRRE